MRVYNFSPGPATLPEPVLKKIQEDITNYKNGLFWIAEVSHRSPIFTDLLAECRQKLQRVLEIPENYEFFFCHGGATSTIRFNSFKFFASKRKSSLRYQRTLV